MISHPRALLIVLAVVALSSVPVGVLAQGKTPTQGGSAITSPRHSVARLAVVKQATATPTLTATLTVTATVTATMTATETETATTTPEDTATATPEDLQPTATTASPTESPTKIPGKKSGSDQQAASAPMAAASATAGPVMASSLPRTGAGDVDLGLILLLAMVALGLLGGAGLAVERSRATRRR